MAEGPFSENGKPIFFSLLLLRSEEWRILGEGFTAGFLYLSHPGEGNSA
jgi:hypothetical protein